MEILATKLTADVSQTAHFMCKQRLVILSVNVASLAPTLMLRVLVLTQVSITSKAHATTLVRTGIFGVNLCGLGCRAGIHRLTSGLMRLLIVQCRT